MYAAYSLPNLACTGVARGGCKYDPRSCERIAGTDENYRERKESHCGRLNVAFKALSDGLLDYRSTFGQ
jgi:hypothetical protein